MKLGRQGRGMVLTLDLEKSLQLQGALPPDPHWEHCLWTPLEAFYGPWPLTPDPLAFRLFDFLPLPSLTLLIPVTAVILHLPHAPAIFSQLLSYYLYDCLTDVIVLYCQAETVDLELHDDDDFTKTLNQLDERQSKKVGTSDVHR